MKIIGVGIVVVLIVLGASIADAAELAPVGLQKQLLVDDYVIAEKHNITRELGAATKLGVVMEASVPTDHNPKDAAIFDGYRFMRTTILWNEQRQLFQALYSAGSPSYPGYGESRDGIRWTKPFISPDGKSNLIRFSELPGAKSQWNSSTFTIDPTLPWGHEEKFKAAYDPGNAMCALSYSPDGVNWKAYNEGRPVTGRAADTSNQLVWDPIGGRYLLLTRTDLGEKGGTQEVRATRVMVHKNGGDIRSHPTAWETLSTIAVDDPKDQKTASGAPVLQMEAMTLWTYENVYFGLMHVLTAGELMGHEGEAKAQPDRRNDTDVVDFYIGTSRDAVTFDRTWIYAGKPLIERGGDNDFDRNMLNVSSEVITRGDEHWIYYQGSDNQHHDKIGIHGEGGKLGLATLPLDRFIAQKARDTQGTITTKPFTLRGDALHVNVDAEGGECYVAILDEHGEPIPGFTAQDAVATNADSLRLASQWRNNKDLSLLEGRTIRLKFYLRDAKLYSFQITP
jgi:hypothetical protein